MKTSWFCLYINPSIWIPHAGCSCFFFAEDISVGEKKRCHKRAFLGPFVYWIKMILLSTKVFINCNLLKMEASAFQLFPPLDLFWQYKTSIRTIILNYTSTKETPIEFTYMVLKAVARENGWNKELKILASHGTSQHLSPELFQLTFIIFKRQLTYVPIFFPLVTQLTLRTYVKWFFFNFLLCGKCCLVLTFISLNNGFLTVIVFSS